MNETSKSPQKFDESECENARVGYQAAINLWTFQGAEIWARFNVMIVANSIFIGVMGLNIIDSSPIPFLTLGLSLGGIIICVAWFLLMKRSHEYQKYYLYSARELEERYLFKSVKTVSDGRTFANGDEVKRFRDIESKPFKMSRWSPLSAEKASYIVIIVFFAIYFYFLSTLFEVCI